MDSFLTESLSRLIGSKKDLKLIACWEQSALPEKWHRK